MKGKSDRRRHTASLWKKGKNRVLLNNDGMTLIELLTALLILSIVAVVFYHGFLTGAMTNTKAKQQHKATSLAQNIMEGLKAEDINTILFQFSYPAYTDQDGSLRENFDILPGSLFRDTPSNSAGTFKSSFGTYVENPQKGEAGEYVRTDDGKYYLYLTNLSMENTLFDVLVTLDGSAYSNDTKDGAGNALNTSRGKNYNSDQWVQIPAMDSNYDAVVSSSQVYDVEALKVMEIISGFNPDYVKRTITITVEDTPLLSGETISTVSAKYEYFFNDETKYQQTDWVFDNTDDPTKKLRNIFLFYQPYYSSTGYIEGRDTIILRNPDNRELEFYVVKQQTETNLSKLSHQEINYQCSVRVTDSGTLPGKSYVGIHTNLGYNLADGQKLSDPQAAYYLNGTLNSGEQQLKDVFRLGSLTRKQASDKIMDVRIEVFKAGTGSFTTLDEFRSRVGQQAAVLEGSIRN